MKLNRRDFLVDSVLLAAYAGLISRNEALAAISGGGERPYLLTAHTKAFKDTYEDENHYSAKDVAGEVRLFDLHTGKIDTIAVPLLVHVFNQHPVEKNIALGASKWTPSAVVVDLKRLKTVKNITAPGDYRFFGHACFNVRGDRAYISAQSKSAGTGVLMIYNCESWTVENVIDLGGSMPHECLRISPDRIVAAHRRRPLKTAQNSPLSFISLSDGKVTHPQVTKMPTVFHLSIFDDDRLVLGGSRRGEEANLVVYNHKKGTLLESSSSPDWPKGFAGNVLSIQRISETSVAATVSNKSKLIIWNIDTNRLKISDWDERTMGLAAFDHKVFMTTGHGQLHELTLAGEKLAAAGRAPVDFGLGAHMRLVLL